MFLNFSFFVPFRVTVVKTELDVGLLLCCLLISNKCRALRRLQGGFELTFKQVLLLMQFRCRSANTFPSFFSFHPLQIILYGRVIALPFS